MKNDLKRQLLVVVMPLMAWISLSGVSLSVQAAQEYVCEARQAAKDQLPVLSTQCPIGRGLWGKSRPKSREDLFWIQCGIFPQPLTLAEVKPIYDRISVDVWLRPEGKEFRCLIGPYDDYSAARAEQDQIRRLPEYQEAFIRAVDIRAKAPAKAAQPVTMPKKAAKSAVSSKPRPVPKSKAAKAPLAATSTSVQPPVVKNSAVQVPAVKKAELSDSLVMRRKVVVQAKQFVVPFLMQGKEQFYMEYNIAWNRLSYARAREVCQAMDMRLLNEQDWQELIASQVMVDEQWPLHLPYWGEDKRGLFTSGKVTQLTGTSLLNVICVK